MEFQTGEKIVKRGSSRFCKTGLENVLSFPSLEKIVYVNEEKKVEELNISSGTFSVIPTGDIKLISLVKYSDDIFYGIGQAKFLSFEVDFDTRDIRMNEETFNLVDVDNNSLMFPIRHTIPSPFVRSNGDVIVLDPKGDVLICSCSSRSVKRIPIISPQSGNTTRVIPSLSDESAFFSLQHRNWSTRLARLISFDEGSGNAKCVHEFDKKMYYEDAHSFIDSRSREILVLCSSNNVILFEASGAGLGTLLHDIEMGYRYFCSHIINRSIFLGMQTGKVRSYDLDTILRRKAYHSFQYSWVMALQTEYQSKTYVIRKRIPVTKIAIYRMGSCGIIELLCFAKNNVVKLGVKSSLFVMNEDEMSKLDRGERIEFLVTACCDEQSEEAMAFDDLDSTFFLKISLFENTMYRNFKSMF